jgi:hypothetical protein
MCGSDVRADYTFRIRDQNVLLFIGIQNLDQPAEFCWSLLGSKKQPRPIR